MSVDKLKIPLQLQSPMVTRPARLADFNELSNSLTNVLSTADHVVSNLYSGAPAANLFPWSHQTEVTKVRPVCRDLTQTKTGKLTSLRSTTSLASKRFHDSTPIQPWAHIA